MIGYVESIAVFSFVLMYFTFQLSEEHFILKLLNILFSIVGLVLLPYASMSEVNFPLRFMSITYGYFICFSTYFLVYLFWHWVQKSERFAEFLSKFKSRGRGF